MPKTYELISTTTLSSASGTIDLTSIPQTYTDLRVTFFVPTQATNGSDTQVKINGLTGNPYYFATINQNNASAPNNVDYTFNTILWINNQTVYSNNTYPTFYTLDFLDYADTVVNKTAIITASQARDNAGSDLARTFAMINTTSAINQLTFMSGANFSIGSQVKIYGILKA